MSRNVKLIQEINNWKKTLLILSLLPIILLGIIFITYAGSFDVFFANTKTLTGFFRLSNQLLLFNSITSLPLIITSIARISILWLYITAFIWMSIFSVTTYLKLSYQLDFKIKLTIELLLISYIYLFIVSPTNIFLFILGCLILLANLVLIIFYWIYEFK